MAIKPKGKKVTGTNKADKITWMNSKPWKVGLTVNGLGGNDVINFKKSNYKNKLNGGAGNDKIYGGKKNDTIHGNAGNDLLVSGSGSDKLYGDSGKNTIKSGAGNDSIYAGKGNDTIYGGDGSDYISLTKGGKNKVYGGNGNDKINFGLTDNYIDGGAGNDSIYGQGGFNTIKGGAGNDTIRAGMWFSNIDGGLDNDLIDARDANKSTLLGGAGDDIIYGGYFSDYVDGGAGNDKIFEYGNVDQYNTISGGAGNDTITVSSGNNTINGGDNDDEISIIGGVNVINAGTGNNQIHFGDDGWPVNYANTIQGGGGTDTLVLHKLNSFDSFSVEYDGDNLKVACGEEHDIILEDYKNGHSVKYVTIGNETRQITEFITDDQTLDYSAFSTPNTIYGGSGSDILIGGSADDYIVSGEGDDDINGGAGDDTVVLNGEGNKVIYFGYDSGNDTIKFDQPMGALFIRIQDFNGENKNLNFYKDGSNLIIQLLGINNETESLMTLENFFTSENIPVNSQIRLQDFDGNNTMNFSAYINSSFSQYKGIIVQTPDEGNTYNFNKEGYYHLFAPAIRQNNDIINVNNGESVEFYFPYESGDDTIYVNSKMGNDKYFNLHIAGASDNNLEFYKLGNDLIIKRQNLDSNKKDSITLKDYYAENNNYPLVTNIKIFDVGKNDLKGKITYYIENCSKFKGVTFLGTDNGETISTSDSTIKYITPAGGNDIINIDGTGTRILSFEYNCGNDTIVFNSKLTVLALHFEGADQESKKLDFIKSGNNLLIERTNPDETVDTLTLQDYFTTDKLPRISVNDLNGENGSDLKGYIRNYSKSGGVVIRGTDDADTIYSVNANLDSSIYTSPGNDTIIFDTEMTSGYLRYNLHITSGHGDDTIKFQNNALGQNTVLCFEEGTVLVSHKIGDDLIIYHTKDGLTEHLTVKDYFTFTNSSVVRYRIGNETTPHQLVGGNVYVEGSGTIEGTDYADTITGSDSSDIISPYNGTDTITARGGDDTIILTPKSETEHYAYAAKHMYFHNGDGNDTIRMADGVERFATSIGPYLYFDEGTQITSYADNKDFVIARTFTDENDESHTETVTFENWFDHIFDNQIIQTKVGTKIKNFKFYFPTEGNNTVEPAITVASYIMGGDGADTYEFEWTNNNDGRRINTTIIMSDNGVMDNIKFTGFFNNDNSGLGNGNTLLIRDGDDITIWYNQSNSFSNLPDYTEAKIEDENGQKIGRFGRYKYYSCIRIKDYFTAENPTINNVIFQSINGESYENLISSYYANNMDPITNTTAYGTIYADNIEVTSSEFYGDTGNDTIRAYCNNEEYGTDKTKIYGGADKDVISLFGIQDANSPKHSIDGAFVSGGTGNDTIRIYCYELNDNITLEFAQGDGNDEVYAKDPNTGNIYLKFTDVVASSITYSVNQWGDGILSYGSQGDKISLYNFNNNKNNNYTAIDYNENRNFFRHANQSTEISDISGVDDALTIVDSESSDLRVAFNLTKECWWILNNENYSIWEADMSDESIIGINITGEDISKIETIKANDGKCLDVEALQSAVASWMNTNGSSYETIAEAFTNDSEALIAVITQNTTWQ